MGSELVLFVVGVDERVPPNWEAATAAIDTADDELVCDSTEIDDPDRARAALRADLDMVRAAVSGAPRRDLVTLKVRGLTLYISGGITGGDPPTPLSAAIRSVTIAGIAEAAGLVV